MHGGTPLKWPWNLIVPVVFIFFFISVLFKHGCSFPSGTNICDAPNPYLLTEDETLTLTPPIHRDGRDFYYNDNVHCECE